MPTLDIMLDNHGDALPGGDAMGDPIADPGQVSAGKDDSSHSTENMACMIAGQTGGQTGGLRGGQHIVAQDMHPGNVLNTAMRAVGVDQDLGEVVGVIPGLLA